MKKLFKRLFGKYFCPHIRKVTRYKAKGKYKNIKKGGMMPKYRYDVYETYCCAHCGKEFHYWKVRSDLTESQARQFIHQIKKYRPTQL